MKYQRRLGDMIDAHPWPERVAFVCACCGRSEEVFVRVSDETATRAVRERLAVTAISGFDWLLMKGGDRADWLCSACVRTTADPHDRVLLDAAARWVRWSAVDYSVAPGVMS
jgi:hypothetical protein